MCRVQCAASKHTLFITNEIHTFICLNYQLQVASWIKMLKTSFATRACITSHTTPEPGLEWNINKNFCTRLVGTSMVWHNIQFYMPNCMGHKLWSTHQIQKKIFFTATTILFSMLQKYYLERTRILFSDGFSKWLVFAITVLRQRNI